jgi:hypothetical protein
MLSRFTLSKPTQLQLPYQISPLLFCFDIKSLGFPPFFLVSPLCHRLDFPFMDSLILFFPATMFSEPTHRGFLGALSF